MTLQDFISSTNQAQLYILADLGKQVHQHASMEFTITLYRIEDFFVDVYFNRHRLCITHLRAFPQTALSHYYHDEAELILSEEQAAEKPAPRKQGPTPPGSRESFFAWRPPQNK